MRHILIIVFIMTIVVIAFIYPIVSRKQRSIQKFDHQVSKMQDRVMVDLGVTMYQCGQLSINSPILYQIMDHLQMDTQSLSTGKLELPNITFEYTDTGCDIEYNSQVFKFIHDSKQGFTDFSTFFAIFQGSNISESRIETSTGQRVKFEETNMIQNIPGQLILEVLAYSTQKNIDLGDDLISVCRHIMDHSDQIGKYNEILKGFNNVRYSQQIKGSGLSVSVIQYTAIKQSIEEYKQLLVYQQVISRIWMNLQPIGSGDLFQILCRHQQLTIKPDIDGVQTKSLKQIKHLQGQFQFHCDFITKGVGNLVSNDLYDTIKTQLNTCFEDDNSEITQFINKINIHLDQLQLNSLIRPIQNHKYIIQSKLNPFNRPGNRENFDNIQYQQKSADLNNVFYFKHPYTTKVCKLFVRDLNPNIIIKIFERPANIIIQIIVKIMQKITLLTSNNLNQYHQNNIVLFSFNIYNSRELQLNNQLSILSNAYPLQLQPIQTTQVTRQREILPEQYENIQGSKQSITLEQPEIALEQPEIALKQLENGIGQPESAQISKQSNNETSYQTDPVQSIETSNQTEFLPSHYTIETSEPLSNVVLENEPSKLGGTTIASDTSKVEEISESHKTSPLSVQSSSQKDQTTRYEAPIKKQYDPVRSYRSNGLELFQSFVPDNEYFNRTKSEHGQQSFDPIQTLLSEQQEKLDQKQLMQLVKRLQLAAQSVVIDSEQSSYTTEPIDQWHPEITVNSTEYTPTITEQLQSFATNHSTTSVNQPDTTIAQPETIISVADSGTNNSLDIERQQSVASGISIIELSEQYPPSDLHHTEIQDVHHSDICIEEPVQCSNIDLGEHQITSELSILGQSISDINNQLQTDISDMKISIGNPSDVQASIQDHSDVQASIRDHSDVQASIRDHSDVQASIRDHSDVQASIQDHSDVQVPVRDHSDLQGSVRDHSDVQVSVKDHSDVQIQMRNHSDVQAPSDVNISIRDTLDVQVPSDVNISMRDPSTLKVQMQQSSDLQGTQKVVSDIDHQSTSSITIQHDQSEISHIPHNHIDDKSIDNIQQSLINDMIPNVVKEGEQLLEKTIEEEISENIVLETGQKSDTTLPEWKLSVRS